MAKPHSFSPKEAVKLRRQGKSLAEIAEISGLSRSGVQQLLQAEGEVKQYARHKEALPWPNKKTIHNRGTVAGNLRKLSNMAQGNPVHKNKQRNDWWVNEALNWADKIIDSGMDIDYNRDSPPNEFSSVGGFFLKPADEKNWHIKRLAIRARARIAHEGFNR